MRVNPLENDEFQFFIPIDDIQKSKNKKGEEVYEIRGIASVEREDDEGETLMIKGFDLSDFREINWNHRGRVDPAAILGEPTRHEIIKDGKELYIEGILFPEIPMAKATYNLMKAYKKRSRMGNKLHLSVEGKALERDQIDPTKILRSKITGVAICPRPINGSTIVDLVEKGYTNNDIQYDEDISKAMTNEVDKVKKIKLYKSLIEDSDNFREFVITNNEDDRDSGELQDVSEVEMARLVDEYAKAINVADYSHITKESVEGTPKNNLSDKDKENLSKKITKSEIFTRIFNYFSDITIEKAKEVYSIIQKIQKMSSEKEITQETLDKAHEILGLAASDIEKGGKDKYTMDKAISKMKGMYKKGADKNELVKKLVDNGYDEKMAKSAYDKVKKNYDEEDGEVPGEQDTGPDEYDKDVKKSFSELTDIIKGNHDDIAKRFGAVGDIMKAQGDLIKSQSEKIDDLEEKLDENDEFIKSMKEKLEAIEKQPLGRKSVSKSAQAIEKFEKSEDGKEQYSLSNASHRRTLANKLIEKSGVNENQNDFDRELVKAAQDLELIKSFSDNRIIQRLEGMDIKVVQ